MFVGLRKLLDNEAIRGISKSLYTKLYYPLIERNYFMNNIIKKKAPAKINLTLDVTGRRPNGYHDLRMIMQTIDVYDELSFEAIEDDRIEFTMNKELPDKIPPEKNLVYKAALLMKEKYNIPDGIKIHLTKNIPAAAGLAGGSSDCAATLEGINELFSLGLSTDELCKIGVTLGADVPFCIKKGTQLSEGIGEILTELPALPPLWVLLIKPDISVSTAYVYTHLDLPSLKYHPDTDKMIERIEKKDCAAIGTLLSNVLETVTIPEYPVLDKLKVYLKNNGAIGSLMSGSGPTTFGLFQDEIQATMAYRKAFTFFPDYDVILCRTKIPE